MESLAEQIEYGTRCVHGNPLGTPGGYDLMCGLCESGYTERVYDPLYELIVYLPEIGPKRITQFLRTKVTWRESEVHAFLRDAHLRDAIMRWAEGAAQVPNARIYARPVIGEDYYWRRPLGD